MEEASLPTGRSRLRPEREGGACLADPPGGLEISSLRVSPRSPGSGALERRCQKTLACRPTLPLACTESFASGLCAGRTPRPSPCAAVPGPRNREPEALGGREGAAGHGGVWRGMGRASGARLTMVPSSSAHTLLPHSSRPGPEGKEAGSDASRSTVRGGASAACRCGLARLAEEGRKCPFEWSPAGLKRSPSDWRGAA